MLQKRTYILILTFALLAVSAVGATVIGLRGKKNTGGTDIVYDDEVILFAKNEVWGPCPFDSVCYQSTKLYYSGKLVLEGEKELQKQLGREIVTDVIDTIRETNVMNKDCSGPLSTMDYQVYCNIIIDGREKAIETGGCAKELQEIEAMIPAE